MPSHTKIILLLLLFFIDLSVARVLGVREGSILPSPLSEVIAEMEMRKLTEVEIMVDYQKIRSLILNINLEETAPNCLNVYFKTPCLGGSWK